MKPLHTALALLLSLPGLALPHLTAQPSLLENLDRGVVAVRASGTDVFISWRLLGTDPGGVAFNLYRETGGGAPVLLNPSPLTAVTQFTDTTADLAQASAYTVRAVVNGSEQAASPAFTLPANAPAQSYLGVPLQIPAGGTTPDGVSYTYSANDCSVGDLDGDGRYELIVKWDPSNAKDNSQSGHTGNVFLDAYQLDGTRLWRIDLGKNIRAGAHYTQFLVYDFDGDGRAELACRTAPGGKDASGAFVATTAARFTGALPAFDPNADLRNANGYILKGHEFFTIFDGLTGGELASTFYVPPRNNDVASEDVSAWGDNYGNRVDRFLACVAYLDGQRPSLVFCRGYYTRAVLAAWDWRDGQLRQRWVFDTGHTGTASPFSGWRGQGAHSLTVGDVDADGRDEITYGAAAIDDDGSGLYTTLLGHGDALHLSAMDPARGGQQVWMVHEDPGSYGSNGLEFRDARTGALIFGVSGQGADVGRGVAGDIDPRFVGYEMWGSRGGLMTANGTQITTTRPGQMNFMAWWDGDLLREILDGTTISKWDWNTNASSALLAPTGVSSNNGTKATPALSADILGDWREEVVWRASDSSELRVYTTTIPTSHRFVTLMHDRQYRLAIAWQNVGYNQPPHPGFYLGEGMSAPPPPNIVTSLAALPAQAPAATSIQRYDPALASIAATSVVFRVTFNTPVTGVDASDFTLTTTGSLTGAITSVTAPSALAYNVTVSSLLGTGTLRLDLKAGGTGITDLSGAPLSGGFTAGQLYDRATLAWIDPTSGGLWSDSANWDGGVIGDGVGAVPTFGNFDVVTDNTVVLDTPRTIGGLTFGDADTDSAANWTLSDAGNRANVLTLDVASGTPTVTVNALGTGAVATIGATLAGTKGLAKAGAGTLALSSPNTLDGTLSVSGGILRVTTGGALDSGSGTANVSAQLNVAGGTLRTGGLVSASGGAVVVDDGTAALDGGFRTNSDANGTLRINGGTLTTPDVNIRRNAAATITYSSGFIVAGGTASVGTVWLGNSNSTGAMSVEGGAVTATGAITIGNNAGSGRGGGLRVTGGSLTATDSAHGIVLTRASGNPSVATFSGGTSTVEKFTFGYDAAVTAGSGTLTLAGGSLYVGAGGLVRNATGAYTATIVLNSGTLGAAADWSTPLPVTLGGAATIKAADASDAPHALTLGGALGGSGGFTKTGAGTLTLAAANTYAGPTQLAAGTLNVTGSLAAASSVTVGSGATLAGTGTIHGPVALNAGGIVAPDTTTLHAGQLTWHGGGLVRLTLGEGQLALTGALTKGPAGAYAFALTAPAPLAVGTAYPLVSFASTDFAAADFTASGLPPDYRTLFVVNSDRVDLLVTGFGATAEFTHWTYVNGLPDGQRGPEDDPDGDGVENLLEFALGLAPLDAGAGDDVQSHTVTVSGVIYPAITFTRRQNLAGVTTAVQACTDLRFTNLLNVVIVSTTSNGDGTETVVARTTTALSQQPRQFFRVIATLPE
ncbi:MAG TPA: autotransporter-associated beta strand repeat-containing protein [Opitutaceae bacterium]